MESNSNSPAGFVEKYQHRVDDGEIEFNEGQHSAACEFNAILERLRETGRSSRGIRNLFSGRSKVPTKGLYVWGGVGCGKSMLMDMFFDEVEDIPKQRVHFLEFMQRVHSSLHEIRKTNVKDALPPAAKIVAKEAQILCLDEIHIDDIADAMIVGRLFEKLFELGVTICSTSNRRPDDLYKNGLNRHLFVPFISLVKDRMKVHELECAKDFRMDRLQGAKTYFTPINGDSIRAIDKLWNGLTGGRFGGLTLKIKGRDLHIPKFGNGVARSRFWDLCAQPLGAGDFLAIAQAIKMLILEDVPLLSRSNYNEAKRFVLLVDALYESKVRLVVSAAADPSRLYIEGCGSFEFERAISRLFEMQSLDWASGSKSVSDG